VVWSGAKRPIIYTVTGIGNRQPQRRIWPYLGSASNVGSVLQMCILARVNPSNEGLQCKRCSNYNNSKQFTENGNIFVDCHKLCPNVGIPLALATKFCTIAHNIFNIFIPPPSHNGMCVSTHKPSITR